jgi:hypothetical protein
MNEKDFDKIMKGILENPPEFPVDPQAKAAMQGLLDAQAKSSATLPWLRYVAALLLIPLFTYGWSLHRKLNYSYDKIATLEQQISKLDQSTRDTIIQKEIVYQRDTVIKVITQAVANPAKIAQRAVTLPSFSTFSTTDQKDQIFQEALSVQPNELLKGLQDIREKTKLNEKQDWAKTALTSLDNRPLGTVYAPEIIDPLLDMDFMMFPAQQQKNNWHFRPVAWSVGPIIGLGHHDLEIGQQDLGLSLGLRGFVHFGNRLSLSLGAQVLSLHALIEDEGKTNNFPYLSPTDPSDNFEHLDIELTAFQFPVGFQYLFTQHKKFNPFIGGGLVVNKGHSVQYEYKYKTANQGEYYLNLNEEDDILSANTFFARAGVMIDLHDNWSVQVEANYNFDRPNEESYQFSSIRTALLYNF